MVMGSTFIHDDVFREIARLVLEEVEGIYTFEPKGPLAPLLGEKSVKPVVTVIRPGVDDENQESVAYDIRLAALYGAPIPRMVADIRKTIIEKTNVITGYEVTAVDVYITKLIRFEGEADESEDADSDSADGVPTDPNA